MRKIFTLFAAATLTAAAAWADGDTTTPTGPFVYDLDATTTPTIPTGTTAIKVVGTLDATKVATLKAAVPTTVTQWFLQECDDTGKAALTLFQGNTTATDIILPASFVTTDATTGYASDFTDAEKAVFDAIGTQLHSVVAAGPKTTSGMEEVTRTESKQVEVISKNWDGTINYKKDSNGNPIQKTDADGDPVYEKNDDGTYKTDDTGNKIPVYEPETYMEWQQVPVTTTEMVYHYPTALTAYIKQPGTLWTQTATKTNFPDLWSSQGNVSEKIHVPAITATGTLALTDLHKFDNQGNANQDEMIGSGITHLDLSGATLQANIGVDDESKVFKADNKMQKVKLPEGITHIVGSDFQDGELLEIEFPTTVTEIGANAFQNCAKLATATFRETSDGTIAPVTTIGENAFKSTKITSFTIPQTVTSLGQSAFLDCKELASVTLDPECAITTIPYKCFEDTKITEITIPNSVTEICEAAFNGCPLTTVNYGEHPVITKIGKDAFKHTLLTSITIPEGVTEIGEGAFNTEQDHGLEMLIIPASVQKIGAEAFLNQWFKDIFFYGLDAPEIAGNTFMPGQYYGSGSFSADDIRVLDPDGNYVMNSDGSYKKGKDIATGIGSSTEKTTVDEKKAEGYSFVANHEMYENGDNQGHYTSSIHLRAELLNSGNADDGEAYSTKLLKYTDPTRSYMLDDDLLGTSQHWPTHNEMEAAYNLAGEGKLSDGTTYPAGTTTNADAWKNLHKFVLVSFDINNSSQTEWELPQNKFNNGFWWSICLPFDLTKKQVLDVFGSKTRLCRFNRVERTYDAAKQSWHLGLHFTDEVCQYKTVEGMRQEVGDDEIVMHSHAPYMIHPQTDSEKPGEVGVKKIPYKLTKGGEPQRVWQEATTTDGKGQTQTRRYAFVGNYKAKDNNGNTVLMPDYCYFMYYQNVGQANEKHSLAVKPDYKTTWPFGTYSAIVVQHTPNEARDDAHIFFPTAITKQHGTSTTTAAKGSTFVPVWGEEEENVAQGIEEVEFIFPDGERHPGGIYNMSGQRVSGQPQPGLYIRDGRKTVIR